jgi:hypothetical protein
LIQNHRVRSLPAYELCTGWHIPLKAIREVIQNNNMPTFGKKPFRKMGTNESGAAADESFHAD